MQGKLKQSEQRYLNFFLTARDALFITTRDGQWLDMNEAMVKMLGYSSARELSKVTVGEFYANPAEREEHLRLIAEKGLLEEHPVKLRRKDGALIETLITSVPVIGENGEITGFQGCIRDVTEKNETERHIRRLHELSNTIRNINQIIVQEKELIPLMQQACRALFETAHYQGCTIAVKSKELGQIVPLEKCGSEASSPSWIISPEGRGSAPACIRSAVRARNICVARGRRSECLVCPHRASADKCISIAAPMMKDGEAIGIIHIHMQEGIEPGEREKSLLEEVARDLVLAFDKIQAENALVESEERYRSLTDDVLDNSTVGVCILDSRFRIAWINRAMSEYFDLDRKTSLGIDKRRLIDEKIKHIVEDGENFAHLLHQIYSRNLYNKTFECHVLEDKNRNERWLEHRSQPIRSGPYAGGRIEHYYDITDRKLADKKEQNLRKFWQLTIDSLKNHITITDETGSIIAVNKAWRDFADRNNLAWEQYGLGTNYLKITEKASGRSSEKAAETAREITNLLSGKTESFDLEYPCHSPDKRRWFILTGTRFVSRMGVRLVLSHQDITARKLSEEALEYRLHFEKLVSSLSHEFINVPMDSVERRIDNALSDLAEFAGADRAYVFQFDEKLEFMANTHEWSAPETSPPRLDSGRLPCASLQWFMSRLKQFQTINVPDVSAFPSEAQAEKELCSSRGIKSIVIVPMVYQNRLIGFIGFDSIRKATRWPADTVSLLQTAGEIFVNALKHREAKQAIEKSEKRYRKIFELSPEAIVLLDTEARVVQVNERLKDWLGYEPEKVIGMDLWELPYLPEGSKRILSAKFARRMTGHNVAPYELDFVTKQGERRVGLIHATALTDVSGRIIADLVLISDITERKHNEQALENTNQQLEDALEALRKTQQQVLAQERRKALTTMASGIAHDINNALTPIHGYTMLMLEDPEIMEDKDEAKSYLQNIYKASQNAADSVRRLRKFYRPREEVSFSSVDLNNVISEAVAATRPRWQEETQASGQYVEMETDLGDIPPVCGNEAELHDILTNLIFNAVDAMPQGGRIQIRTSHKNKKVKLEFSDNGVGMSDEVKQKCLDPFYTTKESGSGLGLASTQGIIERHNGALTIHSKKGEGTTFRVLLPAAGPEQESRDQSARKKQEKAQPLRLLIAEDQKTQRDLLRDILLHDGHEVDLAPSGNEALKQFETEKYDAVITDRAMPGMNGDKLAAEIKKIAPEMPIIMITGFGDIMDAVEEKPEAVDHLLTKPVTMRKLKNLLNNIAGN